MVNLDSPEAGSPSERASKRVRRIVSNPVARAAFLVIGTIGLVALAASVVSPKRARRKAIEPIGDAVEAHFAKAWDEVRPIRDQIAALFEKAGPGARKKLARHLQSWIGHFRAE